ncbi:MAG: UDP-2,3-diacylglucosamine diphosphatase LpxI [Hyphomicrobiaceae bacterium]|nr:UDP-2,3-diacylglucosamine diphosphatase LpxI [Hyphomicrobiaceae bacterium]
MKPRLAILAGDGGLVDDAIGAARGKGYEIGVFAVTGRTDVSGDVTRQVDPSRPMNMLWRVRQFRPDRVCLVGAINLSDRERGGLQRLIGWVAGRKAAVTTADGGLSRGLPALERVTGGKVIGVHELIDGLAVAEGHLAGPTPKAQHWDLCDIALSSAWRAGSLDLGQALVATRNRVIAVEDIAGTNALIDRVADLRVKGLVTVARGELALAKARKPDQPDAVDLPTIGAETLRRAAGAGIGLICVHAGNALLADREEVADLASDLKITVLAGYPSEAR